MFLRFERAVRGRGRLPLTAALILLAFSLLPLGARAQGSKSNQTLLKVNMVRGFVTVSVNGQKVGRYGKEGVTATGNGIEDIDISRHVRPGKNRLTLAWSEKVYPMGEVSIGYAKEKNRFRQLADLKMGVFSKPKESKTVTFTLPQANGAMVETPTAGKKPRPGSGAHQTLMTANITRGNVTAFVNGKKVGSYNSGVVPLDISNYVKGGENTLRLSWSGSQTPIGSLSIAYAEEASRFRTVAKHDLGVFTKTKGGGSVTFILPAEAGK